MSNPANPQTPYSPPTHQGSPAGYAQQAPRGSVPLDRAVLRQILFGGVIVVVIAVISNLLSIIGSAMYSFRAELIFSLFWSVFVAAVFVVGAGASALYFAPLAKATSTADLLKKLAVAAGVGAAALLVLNFIFAVVTGGQYLVQMIVSSGILGSISSGITYGAFFALGVFVARALPVTSKPYPGQGYGAQPQAPASQQGFAPRGSGVPQGSPQGSPQAPVAPQGFAPQGSGAPQGSPQAPAAPQGYAPPVPAQQAYVPQAPAAQQAYAPQPPVAPAQPAQQQPPVAPQP